MFSHLFSRASLKNTKHLSITDMRSLLYKENACIGCNIMIKRLWQWFKRILRRFFGQKQVVASQKPVRPEPVRKLLTDVKYESLFLQLLAGVNDEGWSRGRVRGKMQRNAN
jgi:hypothetical protein